MLVVEGPVGKDWMSLIEFQSGQKARILQIAGGVKMRDRLMTMGIREGSEVTIVNRPSRHGPVVIAVAGTQFALGNGLASRVLAQLVDE